ncbi:MAG: glycosyltransferase family 4 protein [Alloprevotella sp.]|nr:glycosyltransferase family 4 protein [Alloprevotella sp.]
MEKKKLLRVTTVDISLNLLLKGQLRFLNQYYDVVGVASDTGCLQAVGEREGIRVENLPMRREIALGKDIVSLWRFIKLFRREKPFIVHANTPKGSLLSMFAAMLCRVPHRIYTVTGLRYEGTKGFLRFVLQMMERVTCFCATKVIPEGSGVKLTLMRHRITSKKLKVVHYGNINGVDTDYFSPAACGRTREDVRRELGFRDDDFVFVFVGRIVRDKGINELAGAMRRLKADGKRCRLILVGWFEPGLSPIDPRNEEFLRGDDSVRFVGQQDDIRPYLLASDAFVFPSYREGFPRGPLEAGAMGLPCLVTRIKGSSEIVVDGVNGLVVPPRSTEELAEKMAWFVTHPAQVAEMAAKARAMTEIRYKRQDVWDGLLRVYKNLE